MSKATVVKLVPPAATPATENKPRLKPRTYATITAHAIGDRQLKARHWNVLAAITLFADVSGAAWPSQVTLAVLTGLSRQRVNATIRDLCLWGYLEFKRKERRRGGRFPANIYRVIRKRHPFDSAGTVSPRR